MDMGQGGGGDPGVLHDLIETEKHLCTISINGDRELGLSTAARGKRRPAKTVNEADPAHRANISLRTQKVTTLFWKLLQLRVDEHSLKEATCRGAMWPLDVLIGGISPRQIPVAQISLANLCKDSVE